MQKVEVEAVDRGMLAEIAGFVHRWRSAGQGGFAAQPGPADDISTVWHRLHWLLVDNPFTDASTRLGYCLRDEAGRLCGLNLAYPIVYRDGSKRLSGLGSGSFFVDRDARSGGFYLFRRFLQSPGHAFYFASTCNANSAALWTSMGGRPVPASDRDFVVPLNLEVMVPAWISRRTSGRFARFGRVIGKLANPVLRSLRRRAGRLTLRSCSDWDKLAELSSRHAGTIAPDRSPAFLQWRYGPHSPASACDIYLASDGCGNEAWFSLRSATPRWENRVRAAVLLDVIWPREKMDPTILFHEIVRMAAIGNDAMFASGRPGGLDIGDIARWAIVHRLPVARAFALTPKGAPGLSPETLDCDDSDHLAWRFPWEGTSGAAAPPFAPCSSYQN